MPVIFSAHAASLAAVARREGANLSKPTVQRSRKSRSCSFSASSVWQSASISAVSVLGRIASHSTAPPVSRSSAVGVTLTKRTPVVAHAVEAALDVMHAWRRRR